MKRRTARLESRIVPALTARTQFGQILRRVEENREHFVISRRGRGRAVLISLEEYLRSFVKPQPALQAVQADAKARGLDRMTLAQINREIRAARREQRRAHAKRRS